MREMRNEPRPNVQGAAMTGRFPSPCVGDGCDLSLSPNEVGGLGRCPDCGWFYRAYEKGYDQQIPENQPASAPSPAGLAK